MKTPVESTAIQQSASEKNAQCVQAFGKYLQASGCARNTRASYVNFARRLSEFLGAKSFTEVTAYDVSQFRLFLFDRGFSPASQNSAFAALRKLYRVLQMADVVTWSPPHQLPRRKVPKRLRIPLTEQQVTKLLATAAASRRDLALLEFLYGTGCRPSEASKMRVEDINLAAATATVRDGKDGDRVVCFGRFAVRAIASYLSGRTTGPLFQPAPARQRGSLKFIDGHRRTYWRVFWREWKELPGGTLKRVPRSAFLGRYKELPTRQDAELALRIFIEKHVQNEEQRRLESIANPATKQKTLSVREIGRIVKRAALRAGLGNRVFPYQLRHSFATHCLQHGMNLRYVQHFMGHEHPGITQVYLHSAPDELVSVHRKFFREPKP